MSAGLLCAWHCLKHLDIFPLFFGLIEVSCVLILLFPRRQMSRREVKCLV